MSRCGWCGKLPREGTIAFEGEEAKALCGRLLITSFEIPKGTVSYCADCFRVIESLVEVILKIQEEKGLRGRLENIVDEMVSPVEQLVNIPIKDEVWVTNTDEGMTADFRRTLVSSKFFEVLEHFGNSNGLLSGSYLFADIVSTFDLKEHLKESIKSMLLQKLEVEIQLQAEAEDFEDMEMDIMEVKMDDIMKLRQQEKQNKSAKCSSTVEEPEVNDDLIFENPGKAEQEEDIDKDFDFIKFEVTPDIIEEEIEPPRYTHQCDICKEYFTDYSDLMEHFKCFHNAQLFNPMEQAKGQVVKKKLQVKCPVCRVRTINLEKHLKREHPDLDDRSGINVRNKLESNAELKKCSGSSKNKKGSGTPKKVTPGNTMIKKPKKRLVNQVNTENVNVYKKFFPKTKDRSSRICTSDSRAVNRHMRTHQPDN